MKSPMKRFYFLFILVVFAFIAVQAQIGYQVAIIDSTTGAPKANENVTVSVTISDSSEATICSENHEVTTNEVGIATIQIGNANTFNDVDWNKLPLWISATVGDVVISKSQILNVPVAEYAKNTGLLTVDILCGKTWTNDYDTQKFSFNESGTGIFCKKRYEEDFEYWENYSLRYEISGDIVAVETTCTNYISYILFYGPIHKCLYSSSSYDIYR